MRKNKRLKWMEMRFTYTFDLCTLSPQLSSLQNIQDLMDPEFSFPN